MPLANLPAGSRRFKGPSHPDYLPKSRGYISGPMRGITDLNAEAFNSLAKRMRAADWDVFNPAEQNTEKGFDESTPFAECIRLDIEQLLKCDAIFLLPGWRESEGANIEADIARALGLPFYEAVMQHNGTEMAWNWLPIDPPPPGCGHGTVASSPRASCLDEAKELITGDRNNAYGPPTQDFKRTADMVTAFGFSVNGEPVAPHHVAIFMMMLKTSRLAWSPQKRDSWVDNAGYAGCGYECAVEDGRRVTVEAARNAEFAAARARNGDPDGD